MALLSLLAVLSCHVGGHFSASPVGCSEIALRYETEQETVVWIPAVSHGKALVKDKVTDLLVLSEQVCRESGLSGFFAEMQGCQVVSSEGHVVGIVTGSASFGLPAYVEMTPVGELVQSLARLSIAIEGARGGLDMAGDIDASCLLPPTQRQDRVLVSAESGAGSNPVVGVVYAKLGDYAVARLASPPSRRRLELGFCSYLVSCGRALDAIFDGDQWSYIYENSGIIGGSVFSNGTDIVFMPNEAPPTINLSVEVACSGRPTQSDFALVSADPHRWREWSESAARRMISWMDLGQYATTSLVIDGMESSFTLGGEREPSAHSSVYLMLHNELEPFEGRGPPRSIRLRIETDISGEIWRG